jgi:hypothetical protein
MEISHPPPKVRPSMAATTGLDSASKRRTPDFPGPALLHDPVPASANSLTSEPALKALSPAPVTTDRADGLVFVEVLRASISRCAISSVTRLRGGFFRVSFATPLPDSP